MRLPSLVREGCPSELHLDRFVLGELVADEDSAARAHIDGCSGCRARLADIEATRAAFLAADVNREVVARPRARRSRWIAAAAAVSALAVVVVVIQRSGGPGQGRGVRTKGTAADDSMAVFVARGSGGATVQVTAGDPVAVGDRLQMTITLRERRFVALLGVDATRVAHVYFPDGERAAAIEPAIDMPLPASIRLDATPGREDFVMLFCDQPIALAPVRAALAADLAAVPAGCASDRLHVVKPGSGGPR